MRRLNKLETDSRDAILRSVRDTYQRAKITRLCGIYFLFDKDELVYIGQAVEIPSRVSCHIRDPYKHFTHYAYHLVPQPQLNRLEAELIDACWPTKYNRTCGLKRENQWYSNGIRCSLRDDGDAWVVKCEYYDAWERKPVVIFECHANYDVATARRMRLAVQLADERDNACKADRLRQLRLNELGGSPRKPDLDAILKLGSEVEV